MIPLMLRGMIEGQNWIRRLRRNYQEQIIKDLECKSYLR